MAIFDRLPPKLRRAVADCPLGVDDQSLRGFFSLARQFGEDAAVAALPEWVRRNLEAEAIREASAADPLSRILSQAMIDSMGDRQVKKAEPVVDLGLMRASVHWGHRRKRRK